MRWTKHGVLVPPPTQLPWCHSHAALPCTDHDPDGNLRLYFTTRDEQRRSHIARGLLRLDQPNPELILDDQPVLTPGSLGAFDDSGVMTSCVVRNEDRLYLYYQGWALGVTVPFYISVGCAVSDDGGSTFVRASPAPVLGRSKVDPYMVSSPWVMVENNVFRMWYVSASGWGVGKDSAPHYILNLRYAESTNGLDWNARDVVILDHQHPGENVIARPMVVKDGDRYRMWYSWRGDAYRMGYAESDDGLTWERHDDIVGIAPSAEGWDSDMIEYGCVVRQNGRWHMFYNGNGFGATGIGHATHDEPFGAKQ